MITFLLLQDTEAQSDHKDPPCINTDLKVPEKSKPKSEDCDFSGRQNSALSRKLSRYGKVAWMQISSLFPCSKLNYNIFLE